MIVTPNVFPKLRTLKILVRPISKKRRFRTRFVSEHVKASLKGSQISMRALQLCFFVILREAHF